MTQPQITAASWFVVAALGVTWGATFMGVEIALTGFTPYWVAAIRIFLAAALMMVIWRIKGGPLFTTSETAWPILPVIGLLTTAAPFTLIGWGQQYVTSGFAGVCMAAVALVILPLAHFFLPNERLTPLRVVGFLVGFAGVVVLIGPTAFASTGVAMETAGRFACLGAAICYGIATILLRCLPPADPIGLAAVMVMFGAVFSVPVALLLEGWPPIPSATPLIAVTLLGLIPTAAANLLAIVVIRSAGPVFFSLVNYQVPVWSVVLGAALLGEALPHSLLSALVLILAGVALSQWPALRGLFARG